MADWHFPLLYADRTFCGVVEATIFDPERTLIAGGAPNLKCAGPWKGALDTPILNPNQPFVR